MGAPARVKIYQKGKIVIDHLNFRQLDMLRLGNVLLGSRKEEISRGLNGRGAPAKPLNKYYARKKSRLTKFWFGRGRNIRDLSLTGKMIRGWTVRTVSETQAKAFWSTRKERIKAQANNDREPFIEVSPRNQSDVLRAGLKIFNTMVPRLVQQVKGFLNG